MAELGTRLKQSFQYGHPPSQRLDRGLTQDLGMTKRVVVATTFTAVDGRATAASATFANFAVGDRLRINDTASNNGEFQVVATDADTYIQLDLPVKDEGPVTAEIRTI